jgi:hypothetical protein
LKYWVLIGFTVTALIMPLILHFTNWPVHIPADERFIGIIGSTVGLLIMALICFYFRLEYWFIGFAVAASIMALILLLSILMEFVFSHLDWAAAGAWRGIPAGRPWVRSLKFSGDLPPHAGLPLRPDRRIDQHYRRGEPVGLLPVREGR